MCLLLVCGDNRGRREMRSLFMQFLSLDISACVVVGDQILRDRVWQVQQSRFAAGTFCLAAMLRTFLCRTAWLLANSVNRSAAVFLGHGPDWHTVEARHWSWCQAWSVWLQPPSERAWAPEATGAGGGEEAAFAPGAGEGPAGTATARWGDGRIHTSSPAAACRHTSRGRYTGTYTLHHYSCQRYTPPTSFYRLWLCCS